MNQSGCPEEESVSPDRSGSSGKRAPNPLEAVFRECLQQVARGEQQALARLYQQTFSMVYGSALWIVGDTADAEEVTLDVYAQVWVEAKNFDVRRGSAIGWLLMLTRSRAIDRVRAASAQKRHEQPLFTANNTPSSDKSVEHVMGLHQERERISAAMDALSPGQRQAIQLAFFSGLTHRELAMRLNEPLGTVKTRIRGGMLKLREILAP